MTELSFGETRVSCGFVFSLPLSLVPQLKERILSVLEGLPEVKAIYQRASPGRLRILNEVEGEPR